MNNSYQGTELPLFSQASNWKKYFSSLIKQYIRGSVLEVGAGSGNTTPFIFNEKGELMDKIVGGDDYDTDKYRKLLK